MTSPIEDLFARAIPKLEHLEPDRAKSMRKKLGRLLAIAWTKGPEKLERSLGIAISSEAHEAALDAARTAVEGSGTDAFLKKVQSALGEDETFVRLARSLAKAYARAKEKKAASGEKTPSERVKKAPSERLKKAPSERVKKAPSERLKKAPSGRVKKLSISSHDDDEEAPAVLAVPDEPELAIPDDDAPAAAVDEDGFERIKLEEVADPAAEMKKLGGSKPKEPDGPDEAAARAIERWKKEGDPEELASARKLYKEALKSAEAKPARAAARAGLALVDLLSGDDAAAKKLAEQALLENPIDALAVSVAMRAARGEGVREQLRGMIARARAALSRADRKTVLDVAKELDAKFADEPFGALLRVAEIHDRRNDPSEAVAAAWKKYPSKLYADVALGAGLDQAVVRGAVATGFLVLDKDETQWAKTANPKEIESKDNALAGAFQIALGVGRVAIGTRSDVAKPEEQEIRTGIGQALLGLQHFDHAVAAFTKARALDRTSGTAYECNKGEERCNVLRRAFDKPGIKAKLGQIEGVGTAAFRKTLAARLERIAAERKPIDDKLTKEELDAARAVVSDSKRRAKVAAALKSDAEDDDAPKDDILARIAENEKKLSELESSKDGLALKKEARAEPSGGGGFFGKLGRGLGKAIDGVKDVAKSAELAMRRQVVEAKLQEAVKALGKRLREGPPEGDWGDATLDGFVARAAALEARIDQLDDEAGQVRKAVARAQD